MTATLVSELLAGEKTSIDISPFAPNRFGIGKSKQTGPVKYFTVGAQFASRSICTSHSLEDAKWRK